MILQWYIVREHIAPFIYSLLVITFVLVLDFISQLIKLVLDKGLPFGIIFEVFLLNLPWMLALSIPMAVLVAVLMAFGRLSQDNEIIALNANGVSLQKLMLPVLFVTVLMSVGLVFFNNYLLPEANHRASKLMGDISRKKPLIAVEEGMLIDDFPGFKIQIENIDVKTSRMQGIKIYQEKPNGVIGTTVAESGYLEYITNKNLLKFTLFNGEIHEPDKENISRFYRTRFTEQVLYIKTNEKGFKRTNRRSRGDRELSAMAMLIEISKRKKEKENFFKRLQAKVETHREMLLVPEQHLKGQQELSPEDSLNKDSLFPRNQSDSVKDSLWERWDKKSLIAVQRKHRTALSRVTSIERMVKAKDRFIAKYLVEVHKKYSLPVACIVFLLIGAPLGIMGRSGGISVGISYSLFFFVLYWIFLIGGETWADNLIISPAVAMWSPNVLIGGIGLLLLYGQNRRRMIFEYKWLKKIGSFLFKKSFFKQKTVRPIPKIFFLRIISSYAVTNFLSLLFFLILGLWIVFVAA